MFGDEDDIEVKPPLQRYGVPALLIAFVALGAWGIMAILTQKGPITKPYKEPPHITTVTLPPPPPPPPPQPQKKIEEKPTEQPKAEKVQTPKTPPKAPSPPAALTATAGAGNDAFGLKAGEGGGGDCVGDCGNGDGGDAGAYYENVVKGLVDEAVRNDDRLRRARYAATVSFVIDRAGHLEDVQFQNFDGDADIRAEVIRALSHIAANETIPADMTNGKPWVVRLRAHAPG